MRFVAGDRVGVYEIQSALGAGGMGEVYRAFDRRLERHVALKVLPPEFADQPDALARFEREAKAAAALSHPNILAIHDFGVQSGVAYAATELLEGATLRARLAEGPLPIRKAVDYAVQAARGLAAAHDRGIVHRDVKPENIFVGLDGQVKILDFGLARQSFEPAAAGTIAATAPVGTSPGVVLGTVGYMAPEQVRGEPADARSDIFALGVVLYETLAGQRAFRRDTAPETMTAILREDPPDLASARPDTPPALTTIVHHCLEKSPSERFQSARDVAFALESLAGDASSGAVSAAVRRPAVFARPVVRGFIIGAAVAAAIATGYFWSSLRRTTRAPSFHRLTFRRGTIFNARFDSDGRSVLYSASFGGDPPALFATRLDSPDSRAVDVRDSDLAAVSTTGEMALIRGRGPRMYWYAGEPGVLARASVAGGAARDVARSIVSADWSPDGSTLAVVRRVGGRSLIEYPLGTVRYETTEVVTRVRVSPNGRMLAFNEKGFGFGQNSTVRIWDGSAIVRSLPTNAGADRIEFAWAPNGKEVWFGESMGATSNDLRALDLSGRMRTVAALPIGFHLYDIAPSGAVLAGRTQVRSSVTALDTATGRERDVSWLDMSESDDMTADGRRVLMTEFGEGGGLGRWSVFVRNSDGSPAVRLGEGQAFGLSPDGRQVLALRRGPPPALVVLPTGAGDAHDLPNPKRLDYFSATWLHDGRRVAFAAQEPGRGLRYWVQPLDGDAAPVTPEGIFAIPGLHPMSDDDRFLATQRAEDHAVVIYPIGGGSPKVFAELSGMKVVRWIEDGRALLVASDDVPTPVYRVDIQTGARTLRQTLMPSDPAGVINISPVLVSADGRSFVYTYQRDITDLYVISGLE